MMNHLYKTSVFTLKTIVGISIVTSAFYFFVYGTHAWELIKNQLFYNVIYGGTLSIVNSIFFQKLTDWLSWEEHTVKRLIVGVVGSVILTMSCVFLLNIILWVWIYGHDYSILFVQETRIYYLIALLITVFISLIGHAYYFFIKLNEEKILSSNLQKEKLRSELLALRAHVDPHFLFNSFNVLSGLIEENKEKAHEFLDELSNIYRYILLQSNKETTQLQNEIDFAKSYYNLQAKRFENSLLLEIEIDEELLERKVPSLVLQLLLENAIKHNTFSKANPLKIKVTNEGKMIVVQNKKSQRENVLSNGMGLKNIRERYALLSRKQVIIENGESFIVKLPLL